MGATKTLTDMEFCCPKCGGKRIQTAAMLRIDGGADPIVFEFRAHPDLPATCLSCEHDATLQAFEEAAENLTAADPPLALPSAGTTIH